MEPAQLENPDENHIGTAEEGFQTGQAWKTWRLIVIGVMVIIMGISMFFVIQRKRKEMIIPNNLDIPDSSVIRAAWETRLFFERFLSDAFP